MGCKFGPNDLSPRVWDELIAMALERAFVDRIVDRRREQRREAEAAQGKARQQAGTPGPGQTIFPHSRPFVR